MRLYIQSHLHPLHSTQVGDWLKLAGLIFLALMVLLALVALVFLMKSYPSEVPVYG